MDGPVPLREWVASRPDLFRRTTPEALIWSLESRGLDGVCTDEDTLAAAARIHARYLREREAGAEAAVAS
jgi:hypothetical protein